MQPDRCPNKKRPMNIQKETGKMYGHREQAMWGKSKKQSLAGQGEKP